MEKPLHNRQETVGLFAAFPVVKLGVNCGKSDRFKLVLIQRKSKIGKQGIERSTLKVFVLFLTNCDISLYDNVSRWILILSPYHGLEIVEMPMDIYLGKMNLKAFVPILLGSLCRLRMNAFTTYSKIWLYIFAFCYCSCDWQILPYIFDT